MYGLDCSHLKWEVDSAVKRRPPQEIGSLFQIEHFPQFHDRKAEDNYYVWSE